uniref:Uncharacterized protein n=1 Tax=Meloidogyne enterolobii TaxID=390850 RepID=A0A6V7TN64_MELEN|nr:unnamed protein product [Meloidogyne enterolobii]
MFTLEFSKRPSVAIKFFLTFIEGATIFVSNKWLLRENRYACYTEYQFHGEHVRKHVIPKHLMENLINGFDDISKNIKNEDLNNFTGKVCKNIGEQVINKFSKNINLIELAKELLISKKFKPNNDKEICLSSPNSLNFNCKINFEKLRLGVEYKPSISSIMKNSGKIL